jgi:nitroreductase/NAD-dependent dihydropyrimidine dehydrogenase PreA subunit
MINFQVDKDKCSKCGFCGKDCPARIIDFKTGYPKLEYDKENSCYRCMHCFSICPHEALSTCGLDPKESQPLVPENLPDPSQVETLIRGRRSVRFYQSKDLDKELIQKLLDVAWQAPTGVNMRQVRFNLIDNSTALNKFREKTYLKLGQLVHSNQLPKNRGVFADFVKLWEEKGVDVLFRGAPHLVVASAPKSCASPLPDCLIALSYFELFAQSNGVGTVWNGLVKWAIDELVPELRRELGVPDEHIVGYTIAFGFPMMHYARTVDHGPAIISRYEPG